METPFYNAICQYWSQSQNKYIQHECLWYVSESELLCGEMVYVDMTII